MNSLSRGLGRNFEIRAFDNARQRAGLPDRNRIDAFGHAMSLARGAADMDRLSRGSASIVIACAGQTLHTVSRIATLFGVG